MSRLFATGLLLWTGCASTIDECEDVPSSDLVSGRYIATIDASTHPDVRALLGEPVGDVVMNVDAENGVVLLSYTDASGAAIVHELEL